MDPQTPPPPLDGGGSGLSNPPIPGPQIDFVELWETISGFFTGSSVDGFFGGFFGFVQTVLSFASLFFMLMIIYTVIQRNRVLAKEAQLYQIHENDSPENDEASARPKFASVLNHLESDNASEWKIAIIEADNILYEVLRRAGYVGDTLGEMLTYANEESFRTIESAWRAHKVRNQIAHDNHQFDISRRQAKQVVELYKEVFREFEYL